VATSFATAQEQWGKKPPSIHAGFGGTLRVEGIRLLRDNAGRPEWSPIGNEFIAYHTREKDGYYDIHLMKADGSEDRCLTRDHPELPNGHIGQPSWHPSGEWIVFQAEKESHVLPKVGALAAPGIGFHNDVWIMSRDGKKIFRLTDLKTKMKVRDRTPTCGILQPHFSHDGKKLSWSERVDNGGKWGKWVIRVVEFEVNRGIPEIRGLRSFFPGVNKQYYESNDFMPDDKNLLICGNLERGQDEWDSGHIEGALHIYVGHLEERLTEVPTDKAVAVICNVGHRAGLGASILLRAGFTQVYNVLGSVKAWVAASYPVTKT